MGMNMYKCESESCNHVEYRYASCKNRACSVCSWLPREKWKMQRANDMIPDTAYYHDVFTIPYELSRVAAQNQIEVQTLLFKCVSETLKSFEESHCKGGKIGFTLLLHTWSTRMLDHYHIHAILPGGYLLNGKWNELRKYMFPAKALAELFRNKFCSGMRSLYRRGLLKFHGDLAVLSDMQVWDAYMDRNYRRKWHVHTEPTRGTDPGRLIGYLSNYVYKTAIDHSRIVSVSEKEVVYNYRSHEDGERGNWNSMALSPSEFLRRFAKHIQPKKFTRIRYYGILAGGVKKSRLSAIFGQKGKEYEGKNQRIHRSSCETILGQSGNVNLMKCPKCGCAMLSMWEMERRRSSHGPPVPDGFNSNGLETNLCA